MKKVTIEYDDGTTSTHFDILHSQSLHTTDEVVDIPEDTIDPIKWINNDMDNQPDEPILDQYIDCITNKEPDVLPSYIDKLEWKRKQPEYMELRAELRIKEDALDPLFDNRYQEEVVIPYRKELREWYMKRKNSFPATKYVEVDGMMLDTDASNITNDKINNAINSEITTRELTNNGTEDTSTEGSGSN